MGVVKSSMYSGVYLDYGLCWH